MPTKEKQPKRRLKLVIPDVRGESIDDLDEIKLACAENLLTTVLAWRMLAEETPTVASLRKKIERLEKLRGDLNARRLRVIHGLETSGKIVREEFANLRQSLPSPAPETVDDLGVSPHSDHLHALIQVKDPRGPRAYERLKRLRSHYAVLQTGDRQRDGLADAVSKIEASLEELNAALERQQALRSGINRLLEVIGKPQERIEDLELNSMLPAVTILQRELDRTAGSSRPISPEPMTERNIASIVDRLSEEATFRATVISRFIDPVMVTFGIDPRAVNVSADNWSARLKELRRQLGVPVPDEADSGPLTTTERKQLQMLTRFGNVPTNQLCPLLRRMAERREVMAVFTTTDAQLVRDAVWEICHSKGEAHIDRAMTYAEHRFRWVDRDRNGFLGSSDLRWAIAEESGGENKRILKRWLDKVGAIEELSNDEYGDENDGLHSGDLAKYKGWEDPLALGYGASTDDLLRMARESDCKTERRDAIFKLFQSIREKSNGSSQACVRPNAVFQLAATSAGDKAPSNELRPGMLAQAEDKATLTLERFVERAGGKLPVMTFTDERDAAKKLRAMFHADDFVDTLTFIATATY